MKAYGLLALGFVVSLCACRETHSVGLPLASGMAGAAGASAAGANAAGSGGAITTGTAGTDALPPLPPDKTLPIVFVHGFAGSGQQFMSQAQRFVANGYPADRIRVYDHDGAGFDTAGYVVGLTAVVDGVLAEFKVTKVYLVGHSRGTLVSTMFLSNPTLAAKVEKYIAVDGSPCPTTVPCIAPNQAMFPGQKHVEVCTSKESFAMEYEFLLGTKPQVVDIVRQRAPVSIAGRAVNFPANTGRAGATLNVYEVNGQTGVRVVATPQATFPITDTGNWGPTTVDPDKFYELELVTGTGLATHYYAQRFLRSTNLIRLLSGPPDAPARVNTNSGDSHSAIIVMRQREWLATDVLELSTKTATAMQPVVNAVTTEAGAANSIGLHIHDDAATPGMSTLAALPYFSSQPFQYGIDVFLPATTPAIGTITARNLPRGDAAKPQILNVPNWKSSTDLVMLMFNDFPQD